MKTLNILLTIVLSFTLFCCSNDDEEETVTPEGSYTMAVTGNIEANISGKATFEIDDDLFRISLGQNPPDLVMNYMLTNNQTLIPIGTYEPVSATYTGMPADQIAVQYNDGFYFGDSGSVTITTSNASEVAGNLDVILADVNGNTIVVKGDFTAVPK